MKGRSLDILAITVIAAACAAVMYRQLVMPGIFTVCPDDTVYYINWARRFSDAFREGVFYPRWMPGSHGSYGSPTLIFYPPLVMYPAALLELLTGDAVLSITLLKLIGLFLSGITMYIFAKDLWGRDAGLAAALVYIVLPYRVFDEYFLVRYGAMYAYIWFPLLLHFARKAVADSAAWRPFAALAVCYALLCITHMLCAYMFTPVLFAFGLVSAVRGRLGRSFLRLALATLIGLCLSAFYVLPALAESRLVHLEMLLLPINLQYKNNYLFNFLGAPYNPYRGLLNYTGQAVIISCIFGLGVCLLSFPYLKGRTSRHTGFFTITVVLSLFLMSSLSGFIWDHVPGFNMLQFPDRWANILVFGLSCLTASAVSAMREDRPSPRKEFIVLRVLLFMLCAAAVLNFYPGIFSRTITISRGEIDSCYRKGLDVSEYVPKTVSLEWLSGELKKQPAGIIVPLSGGAVDLKIDRWGAEERSFSYDAPSPAVLRIRTFYYPGWRAFVDGRPAGLSAEAVSGAMLMDIPAGTHRVRIVFSDTPDRVWGKILSALSALLVIFIFIRSRDKSCYN